MEIKVKATKRQYLILKNWNDAEKHVDVLEGNQVEILDISEMENGKVRLYF